jgi:DNA repair protein RadC
MAANNPSLESIRERFSDAGADAISDYELLALVIGSGKKSTSPSHEGALHLALTTLKQAHSLQELARMDLADIIRLPGLGPAKACLIKAAVELGKRVNFPAPSSNETISCSTDVANWLKSRLQDHEKECIIALLLDQKNRLLKKMRISEGSWNTCLVDPKVVFSACLRQGAPAVILVHNHPSGDPTPSRHDLELTERMTRAGNLVDVKVLDHIIVGREGFTSLADTGLL